MIVRCNKEEIATGIFQERNWAHLTISIQEGRRLPKNVRNRKWHDVTSDNVDTMESHNATGVTLVEDEVFDSFERAIAMTPVTIGLTTSRRGDPHDLVV